MFYLLLAVISSAMVSIIMRMSEKHVRNGICMLSCNYVMCAALAAIFTGVRLFPFKEQGFPFSLLFGLLSGLLYLAGFVMLQYNVHKNGVILSSVFMKLGVLVPAALAVMAFGEQPRAAQIIGFAVAVLAIVFINLEKGTGRAASGAALILLLLAGGAADATSKVFEQLGSQALRDNFLLYTFLAALLFSVALARFRKQRLTWMDLGFGLLIGVPNYFSARFLLLSLSEVPAMIAYPSFSVATIVAVAVIGAAVFGEKLTARRITCITAILGALVLLNI